MFAAMNPLTLEDRLADLEQQFVELRADVLNLVPKPKDWRTTVGMMPDDAISREADRLGREWREQANQE